MHCFKVDHPGTYNFGLIGDLVLHGSGPGFVILNFRIKGQFLIAFSAILGQCLQTKGVGHKLDPVTQQCFSYKKSGVRFLSVPGKIFLFLAKRRPKSICTYAKS